MCFSQPRAPVNKPNYAPEDAYKHFDVSVEDDADGTKRPSQDPSTTPPRTSVPQVKRGSQNIRM